jgi:hypothetical protein
VKGPYLTTLAQLKIENIDQEEIKDLNSVDYLFACVQN